MRSSLAADLPCLICFEALQIFNPDILPLLAPVLSAFCPPYPPNSVSLSSGSPMFSMLLSADFEVLEESCTLIESLSLDVEDVRLSLARGLHFTAEHGGVPCLATVLDFIEKGDYPPFWQITFTESDRKRRERVFDNCKAALIKSVVEVAGEERNEDVLWDDSEDGGEFVCRMVEWIKKYITDMDKATPSGDQPKDSFANRDDLVICATLSLGNLARRGDHFEKLIPNHYLTSLEEKNSTVLLSPPHSLAPFLTSQHLLSPSTDVKVKHGVIGLLKHLAQSSAQSQIVHAALGSAGVVQHIAESGIWDEKADDIAEVVQVSAIGIVRHMCNANGQFTQQLLSTVIDNVRSVENTFALVLPSPTSTASTGLSQVLALVRRTNSTPVRSEGTRVLVNVIRSLCQSGTAQNPSMSAPSSPVAHDIEATIDRQKSLDASMRTVLTSECAFALASLVGRSGKYPLLVNEGVVALSLMCTQPAGGN